jgi:transposase-like protein
MNVNARLTPLDRERIVRQVASGQTPEAVAEAAGVYPRTVRNWVDRYRREGLQVCRIALPGNVLEHSHKPLQTIILSRS